MIYILQKLDDLPEKVKEHARTKLFTEPYIFTEGESKRLKAWIESPLNSKNAEPNLKLFLALAPFVGQELLLVRVNFEETSYQFYLHPIHKTLIHRSAWEYDNIERFIKDSHKITEVFGYWPSFHDAEVHRLTLDRGSFDLEKQVAIAVSMKVAIEFWEMSSEVDYKGHFVHTRRTRAMLKFDNVEAVHIVGFNHQNAIQGLWIERVIEENRTFFKITFDSAYGLESTFSCSAIEVLTATPVSKDHP